jgi:hypothetical protein
MENHSITLADIYRASFSDYCNQNPTQPAEHWKIARAIMNCHTSVLGGHVFRCGSCSHLEISYNSCRNRHCPSCQAGARAEWVEKRVDELLPVPYFHVVFTVPSQLNPFALRNKTAFYSILFKAAAETLQTLARDEKHLGADIGFIAVLHTWGQNLMDHPHLHCVVPAGGLNKDRNSWVETPDKDFLFPVTVVSRLFRGKFLDMFRKAIDRHEIIFHGALRQFETDRKAYLSLIDKLYTTEWVVYLKEPFGSPRAVLGYLGRYTHRIAISNNRLVEMTESTVSFRWKDYADQNREKVMTISRVEFIRRFMLHALPAGFVRIRYFGFMGQTVKKNRLQQCRKLLQAEQPPENPDVSVEEGTAGKVQQYKVHSWCCPECKKGVLSIYLEIPRPHHRNVEMAAVA